MRAIKFIQKQLMFVQYYVKISITYGKYATYIWLVSYAELRQKHLLKITSSDMQ